MRPPGLRADVVVERGTFRLAAELAVGPGEVLAVLGPNGAGKTTLLRSIAGLVPLTGGAITVGDETWDDARSGEFVPPVERAAGLVFQDYRLFPHLSVLDNVAFPDRARGASRRTARRTAADWLQRMDLVALASRRPAQLSGGQAQRVALARALASGPRVLLLDEPLAALDARTRLETRSELRRHLAAFDGPSILVSHDALDAMVLADRILVLEVGRAVQEGEPADVARRPATEYVARLVGLNLYPGTRTGAGDIELDEGGRLVAAGRGPDADSEPVRPAAGARMLVAVAPSAISLHTSRPDAGSARNTWSGVVRGLELLTDRVRVDVQGAPSALVDITAAALADLRLGEGQTVWLTAKATEVVAYEEP